MLQKINSAEILPSGFSCQVYKNNQSGSVAIIVALAMIVLLTITAFVIDTGYLYGAKNKYQNGVEAAAMAGAVSLCDGDPAGVARQVAIDNGLPAGSLVVQAGFYDEKDLYGDFPGYKDFVAEGEGGYPEEQFNNAVMVKLNATEETLMGGFVGKDEVNIGAAAVAYLKRYSMLSMDEDGKINYYNKNHGIFINGDINSNGDIEVHPQSDIPDFNNVNLIAHGSISPADLPDAYPNSPIVDDVRIVDDDYAALLGADADFKFSASDDPNFNSIMYAKEHNVLSRRFKAFIEMAAQLSGWNPEIDKYFFDLSGLPEGSKIFFDAEGRTDLLVQIQLKELNSAANPVAGVTFITNSVVYIAAQIQTTNNSIEYYGGAGNSQVVVVSSKSVNLDFANINLDGVVFFSGENFEARNAGHGAVLPDRKIRVLAADEIDVVADFDFNWDFKFGPPCPPTIPKLGRLESVD